MMEFKRLYDAAFGIEDISTDQFEKGKEARLDKFLQRFKNVTVLLKGPVTIVSNANQKVIHPLLQIRIVIFQYVLIVILRH